jgi:hypothetical protein
VFRPTFAASPLVSATSNADDENVLLIPRASSVVFARSSAKSALT